MLRFFYCTRNIAGLILVISPLAGFLYIDFNFTLSMIFLCSLAAGIPLGSACYNFLNFIQIRYLPVLSSHVYPFHWGRRKASLSYVPN